MKLYEFLKVTQRDYDCYDTNYDACVTVCYIDEVRDKYDKFCVELTKKVDVVVQTSDTSLACDWSKLIADNYDVFKAFTIVNWARDYEDESEFIYQWIHELNVYVAGSVSEKFYNKLCQLIKTLI